jgi:hypothetical protein
MSPIAGASLLLPCVLPARFATVALPTVAMSADTEHGLTSVAASLSKQELWHADDDKPPLRSGDDDDSLDFVPACVRKSALSDARRHHMQHAVSNAEKLSTCNNSFGTAVASSRQGHAYRQVTDSVRFLALRFMHWPPHSINGIPRRSFTWRRA